MARVYWTNNKPVGIIIPSSIIKASHPDSIENQLAISLDKLNDQVSILGSFTTTDSAILFTPLLPLTKGTTYYIYNKHQLINSVQVPAPDTSKAPFVKHIFPSIDTLPENQLKIYIDFSQPMKEGNANEHILLIKNDRDTIRDAFLDVQLELWNKERTGLTVWFDPGRIKRGLQPNESKGNPLQFGQHYRLVILDNWEDIDGLHLKTSFEKKFVVGGRDSLMPTINNWRVAAPKAFTKDSMVIDFNEPLDARLLLNCISIMQNNKEVAINIRLKPAENGVIITPVYSWEKGTHSLVVDTRLEDMAGNNLNHLFDQPIGKNPGTKHSIIRSFTVQ